MATRHVVFRGSREDLSLIIEDFVAMLAGDIPDEDRIAEGFLLSLGFAALSDIKDAFITKARGGTDEMGVRWPPLSKEYLAYGRRFGSGEQARLKRGAGLGRSHRYAPGNKKGLLTASQLKQWRWLFVTYLARFMLSEPEVAAKSHAAAVAWSIMKKRGAKTKLEVFGSRQAQILRDTGVLFNSLSPGLLSGEGSTVSYTRPARKGGEQQIFRTEQGAVIVGTNVEYASAHQEGGKGLLGFPQRVIVPDEQHPVPDVWWDRWARAAAKAAAAGLEHLLGHSA